MQQFHQVITMMEENTIVIRDRKPFFFGFDWSKDIDENLNHEIYFITKSNESLAEHKIKNEIEQLLSQYKYGNNIHEHGKQQQQKMKHKNLFLTCHKY